MFSYPPIWSSHVESISQLCSTLYILSSISVFYEHNLCWLQGRNISLRKTVWKTSLALTHDLNKDILCHRNVTYLFSLIHIYQTATSKCLCHEAEGSGCIPWALHGNLVWAAGCRNSGGWLASSLWILRKARSRKASHSHTAQQQH